MNRVLALVLVGGGMAIIAIGAWLRARRASASDAESDEPSVEGLLAAEDAASGQGGRAGPTEGPQAETDETPGPVSASREEPVELRAARLHAQQQLQALAFGRPFGPVGALSLSEREATAAIRSTLTGIAERPNYAPRRPLLLPKLMQAINDDETSRRDLARLIATDPALAGNLLRLANSPFYRVRPEPVESLDRAVALLGLSGLRSLIASALLQPVFRISGGMFQQFGSITWEHTFYAANAAEAHAAVLENADPFAAQLLALLMGLATIVVFRVATDEFLARQQSPGPGLLATLIDAETAPVARRIAASWELSERIDMALADQSGTESTRTGPVPAEARSLGRSLSAGRFIGALALLHERGILSEEEVQAALKCGGPQADALLRIWGRLRATQAKV
jgi:HD-like signal output (HDOD) protein